MRLIEELINDRQAVISYVRELAPQLVAPYLGPVLFPDRQVDDIKGEIFIRSPNAVVMADVSAWDVPSRLGPRDGITKLQFELPPIRRSMNLLEEALIRIQKAESMGPEEQQAAVRAIFDDLTTVTSAIHARVEKIRMDALTTGIVAIDENGVQQGVDFGIPADNKKTPATPWDDPSADPYSDILAWVNYMRDTYGIEPTRAVTSNRVVNYLLQNQKIRELVHGKMTGTAVAPMATREQVRQLFQAAGIPWPVTYDTQVRAMANDGTISTVRFFPQDRFVMLPGEDTHPLIGETLWGPAPAGMVTLRLSSRDSQGVIAYVDEYRDPARIKTVGEGVAFVTFPFPEAILTAQVLS